MMLRDLTASSFEISVFSDLVIWYITLLHKYKIEYLTSGDMNRV